MQLNLVAETNSSSCFLFLLPGDFQRENFAAPGHLLGLQQGATLVMVVGGTEVELSPRNQDIVGSSRGRRRAFSLTGL